MVQLYDLKSCIKQVTTVAGEPSTDLAGAVIGAVPEGKTRFVTGVKIVNTHTATVEVHIGQGELTSTLDNIKDQQTLASGDTIMYPDTPNKEHPIMSIAEEKFLTLETDTGTADVIMTYFDD